MAALEDRLSGFDEASLSRDFERAGGVWLTFPADGYRSYDASHLNKDGATAFSRDLAARIRDDLQHRTTNRASAN